jgi:hypothetical protein
MHKLQSIGHVLCSLAVIGACAEPEVEPDTQHPMATGIVTLPTPDVHGVTSSSGAADETGKFGTTGSTAAELGSTSEIAGEGSTDVSYPDLPGQTCEALQIEGESVIRPVDIIFAIDTSGSMTQEAESVAANMNAFSKLIVDSGADAHVVLIADDSMCIAPPLGSGQCAGADDNPEEFVHLDVTVNSHDALSKILATAPQWKPQLRADGAKHVVVVSDDDSSMKLVEFHTKFSALGPGFSDYTFHAIVSPIDPDTNECDKDSACCKITADKGLVYLQLVAKTGGVFGDLCDQDFAPVFVALAEKIVKSAPISCAWPLPEPGFTPYDYAAAAVRYALNGVDFLTMEQVAQVGVCPQGKPAWYYDNAQAPAQIVACPWTCLYLATSSDTRVDIELPCKPQPQG